MVETFNNLAVMLKSYFKTGTKSNEMIKKPRISEDNYNDDVISICSDSVDIAEIYQSDSTERNNQFNGSFVNLYITPILYSTLNMSLIIILCFLSYNKGDKELPDYFSLYRANIILYELSHLVLILIGSVIVIIINNIIRLRLSFDNSSFTQSKLEQMIFFGFAFNLFDLCLCLASLYSSNTSLNLDTATKFNENYIYIQIVYLAYVFSIIMFSLNVILLITSFKGIETDDRWFNYKVVILLYLIVSMIIYLYCLAQKYNTINLPILIKNENLQFLQNICPYLTSIMSNLLFLSFYDLFKHSRFSLKNANNV